jgi:hypothetical protein
MIDAIRKGANLIVSFFLGVSIKDVTSGYRAFGVNVIQELLLEN